MPVLNCLREYIFDGKKHFPVLVGFAQADELNRLAWAPAHDEGETQNSTYASELNSNLVKWQRDLEESRWKAIRDLYSESGQIMPNPVVLALLNKGNQVTIEGAKEGKSLVRVTIPEPETEEPDESRPLWILDGQHRIKGLAESKRPDNPIPFVLLANEKGTGADRVFATKHFAEIFTQISTSPKELSSVHKESLYFAFKMKHYGGSEASEWETAMETVKWLCYDGDSFLFDRIIFKPGKPDPELAFGFYNNIWAKLIVEHFLRNLGDAPAPSVEDLGQAISGALEAASDGIDQEKSALFGSISKKQDSFGRIPVQTGFMAALLNYLARDPARLDENWAELFSALAFSETDWDLTDFSTSGDDGKRAPRIVKAVILNGLEQRGFPGGVNFRERLEGQGPTTIKAQLHKKDEATKQIALDGGGENDSASFEPKAELELQADADYPFLVLEGSENLSGFSLRDGHRRSGDRRLYGSKEQHQITKKWPPLRVRQGARKLTGLTYLYGGAEMEFTVIIENGG